MPSCPTVPVTDYGSCTVDYFGNAVGHVDDIKSERDALNQLEDVQGQLAEAQARAVQLENEKAELQQRLDRAVPGHTHVTCDEAHKMLMEHSTQPSTSMHVNLHSAALTRNVIAT